MSHKPELDALALARDLIRCNSVTPNDGGALDVLQRALEGIGFRCERLAFSEPGHAEIQNLYARHGTASPNFCFAGHTDVVPVGDREAWTVDPFGAEISDGYLYGRGASDMKSAIAAFAAAAAQIVAARGDSLPGSISLLITGDEEGEAINGTAKVLDWMQANGENIDACLVGEPTNPERLGDMIKIGRRGSLNATLTVTGTQGHVAYPNLADNPVPGLVRMLAEILNEPLDEGTEHFQASRIEVTTIDVGNPAANVIPARATAAFNVRFNDLHTSRSIVAWLRQRFDRTNLDYGLEVQITGEAFLTAPGPLSGLIAEAVRTRRGVEPELSTTGGTSDARFIKDHVPVAEFGLIGATMHKIDERIALADIEAVTDIYAAVLARFFES
ncbi:MAG TPA: succinyl-diaminopimelate desuccinylase [Alphaproteobacteria bacterium]|nr:succinyl-diaminopimelate desuccinylase [Alphaproteobacteria bacterium]